MKRCAPCAPTTQDRECRLIDACRPRHEHSALGIDGSVTRLRTGIYTAWVQTKFELATSEVQITELRAVSRRPELRSRLRPSEVGHLVNELRALALFFADLPDVTASPDPDDNFLLAIAQASQADYLVTGDKSGLLALERYEGTNIITARAFVESVLSWP